MTWASTARPMALSTVLLAGAPALGEDAALPRTIALGASLEDVRPLLEADCRQIEVLHYEGEMAAPFTDQVQVNCHGLDVWGVRRKVEFMFNDGPLGHVWILVRSEDLPELRESLPQRFGAAVFSTARDEVYAAGTAALRNDPPEILIATPELISDLTGYRVGEP